jgi:deazaflavin-dependent oxidoreductase (nitroreductase family)
MSTNSHPAHASMGTLEPVPPSLLVRVMMRPMTKVLNPLIARMAGRRHFPMAAQIRHVGRQSGRAYVTSVGARINGDVAVIPLTFGNLSDWSKNVRAAGGCTIRVNAQDYHATRPEFLDRQAAAPLLASTFSPVVRASFRMLGIRQYLRLRVVPAAAEDTTDA